MLYPGPPQRGLQACGEWPSRVRRWQQGPSLCTRTVSSLSLVSCNRCPNDMLSINDHVCSLKSIERAPHHLPSLPLVENLEEISRATSDARPSLHPSTAPTRKGGGGRRPALRQATAPVAATNISGRPRALHSRERLEPSLELRRFMHVIIRFCSPGRYQC